MILARVGSGETMRLAVETTVAGESNPVASVDGRGDTTVAGSGIFAAASSDGSAGELVGPFVLARDVRNGGTRARATADIARWHWADARLGDRVPDRPHS